MSSRKLIQLRRRQMYVADPGDRVILEGVVLRCGVCGARWGAGLGRNGDSVPEHEARCPDCHPEEPSNP